MSVLIHETFQPGWQVLWKGKPHNAFGIANGLRLLFKEGQHYGCALYREILACRHVKVSYMVAVRDGWESDSTGKTLGFADLRWKNEKGQSNGHGNRRPDPDGFSFRTWFGKTEGGRMPIGMYVYHLGQKPEWGDSIPVGEIEIGADPVLFECEAELEAGYIRARVDGGGWVQHPITVTDKTAVTRAWLDAYYGGAAVAPKNMMWDVFDYKLENLRPDRFTPPKPVAKSRIPLTGKRVDLSLLHPRFMQRLENFFEDDRIKGFVAISSGCRSYAEQKRLYDKYRKGTGNLAANPDWERPDGFFKGSFHQEQPDGYAYAVDLSMLKVVSGPSRADVTNVAAKYGIRPTVKSEWWHFQPRDGTKWFPCVAYPEKQEAPKTDWVALIALHKQVGQAIALWPLSRGSRGAEVKMVQRRLNAIDFWCGAADGVFGRKTKKAVLAFQRISLLPQTGVGDDKTWHGMGNPRVADGL